MHTLTTSQLSSLYKELTAWMSESMSPDECELLVPAHGIVAIHYKQRGKARLTFTEREAAKINAWLPDTFPA